MTITASPIVTNPNPSRLDLLNSRVVAAVGVAGSTVVAAVARVIAESGWFGRRSVFVSLETDPETNLIVPASSLTELDSLTSVAPSTRQNFSVSSLSTRLHWGQRFILECCGLTQLS